MKLKKAPYLKYQNNNPLDECFIIAGSDAYNEERKKQIILFTQSENNKKPIILDSERLKEIDRLQIAPEYKKSVRIFKSGELSETQKNAICLNLAKNTQAETVQFEDEAMQSENVSDYIQRIRTGEQTTAQIMAESKPKSLNLDLSQEKPTTPELVEAFLEWQNHNIRRDTIKGTIHKLKGGIVWEYLGDEDFKREILSFLKAVNCPNYTITTINKLADLALLEMERLPTENPDLIGFLNGVLNKKTGEFLPHTPNHYLRTLENFNCKTDSLETPNFDKWLDFVADNDDRKRFVVLAGLYMVLTNRYDWQLFLEVTGKAGSGKSIYGNIATMLNGNTNTAIIDIKGIEEPKITSGLIGKTLAYSPDQARYTGTADGLKKLTGGDQIKAQILYKGYVDFLPTVVFMMSTNYPLTFTDRKGGIARRRVIIPFDKSVPKAQKDVRLMEKIQAETYGIVNKILYLFPNPYEAKGILEEYRDSGEADEIKQASNHLIDFAKAFKIIESTANGLQWGSNYANSKTTAHDALFKAYLHYCDCIGLNRSQYLNLNGFKQAFPDALREAGEQGEIREHKIQGTPKINVQWKHKTTTFQEWEG
ncbi:DNA primase family protein [Ursidibacter sp. B-7004-1]